MSEREGMATDVRERLRRLPSVERLASEASGGPVHLRVVAAREELAALRERILAGDDESPDTERLRSAVSDRASRLAAGSLTSVVNATGIVLHTNLGRAPLAPQAAEAAAQVGSTYSNLEYDLDSGQRGSRDAHLEPLLRELTGAGAAMAVNNNAGAVLLALAALAGGREVIVSRGQLVEIGGSFRIPEVLEQSGARLVEVGTTNRTRTADYERALGPSTGAILRVHQSNFRAVGFAEEPGIGELCRLGRAADVAVVDDLGSGALEPIGDEPPLRASVEAGVTLACCSADKLLGGPQAGILAGEQGAVESCRAHPLARALRLDKLQIAALEATLRLHRDKGEAAIPALAMLTTPEEQLTARASRMAEAIGAAARTGRSSSRPGGGSLPLVALEGPACLVDPGRLGADRLASRLRRADPPVVARIEGGSLVLDPRTMTDAEAELAAEAVRRALG